MTIIYIAIIRDGLYMESVKVQSKIIFYVLQHGWMYIHIYMYVNNLEYLPVSFRGMFEVYVIAS